MSLQQQPIKKARKFNHVNSVTPVKSISGGNNKNNVRPSSSSSDCDQLTTVSSTTTTSLTSVNNQNESDNHKLSLNSWSMEEEEKDNNVLHVSSSTTPRNENKFDKDNLSPDSYQKVAFSFHHNSLSRPKYRRMVRRSTYNKTTPTDLSYEGDLEENVNTHKDSYYSPSKSKRKSTSPKSILETIVNSKHAVVTPENKDNNNSHFNFNSSINPTRHHHNVMPASTSSNSLQHQQVKNYALPLASSPTALSKKPQSSSLLSKCNCYCNNNNICRITRCMQMTIIVIIVLCNYMAYSKLHIFTYIYSKQNAPTSTVNSKSSFNDKEIKARIVYYDHHTNNHSSNDQKVITSKRRTIELYPTEFSDNTQLYSTLGSDDPAIAHTMEKGSQSITQEGNSNNCVPMKKWQTTFHPTCTTIHEIHFDSNIGSSSTSLTLFGLKGYWRHAWEYSSKSNKEKVVLKTQRYVHNYEESYYENNRIDAIAMERLTSSPNVVDIYGYCGNTVLNEFADGPRLGTIADKTRSTKKKKENKKDFKSQSQLLQYAIDIASGIADIHEIDYPVSTKNSTFIHLDINPANIVSTASSNKNQRIQLKVNDFNIGILNTYNPHKKQTCGFKTHEYPNPQWRSPEEQFLFLDKYEKNDVSDLKSKTKTKTRHELNEKVDVFSMGHIFYRLICGHDPWNKLEPGGMPTKLELSKKVSEGILPHIPSDVKHSKDIEINTIYKAMMKCYTFDPSKRPSARYISNDMILMKEKLLKEFQKKK